MIVLKNDCRLKIAIEEYINYIDLKEKTKQDYKKILEDYLDFVNKTTSSPTRMDILKYKENLKKRVRSATIQKYIVVIRNFYRWYHVEGYGANIAEGIKGAKIEPTFKREALSIDEAKKLLARARYLSYKSIVGKRNYAMIALLLTTGLRTIEIERADVSDISTIDGNNVLYVMGKGHDDKDSFVKLSPQVYEIIQDYLIERSDEYEPLFIGHGKQKKGERIKTRTVRGVVKELMRQIGINNKKFSAHSLRHTTATISLLEGANIEETQALLRHKDPATTQIYVHRIDKMHGDLEVKVSDALFEKSKK